MPVCKLKIQNFYQVIMGGGRQVLMTNVTGTEKDPLDEWAGRRKDGRDLIDDWKKDKSDKKAIVVQNNEELSAVNFEDTDYLLGIFANGHLNMEYKRDSGPKGQPSLAEMTQAALKILKKNDEGFVLVVSPILDLLYYAISDKSFSSMHQWP